METRTAEKHWKPLTTETQKHRENKGRQNLPKSTMQNRFFIATSYYSSLCFCVSVVNLNCPAVTNMIPASVGAIFFDGDPYRRKTLEAFNHRDTETQRKQRNGKICQNPLCKIGFSLQLLIILLCVSVSLWLI